MQDLLLSAKHLFVGARSLGPSGPHGVGRGLPTMGQVGQQRGSCHAGKRAAFYFSSRKHSAVMPMSALDGGLPQLHFTSLALVPIVSRFALRAGLATLVNAFLCLVRRVSPRWRAIDLASWSVMAS